MTRNRSRWLDHRTAGKQASENVSEDATYFGYQRVSMGRKANRVKHHFDTVAKRYDFMNSLLSFGIHHAWKRQAVRMMALKAGYRVLDVCAGTGDLAILAGSRIGVSGLTVLYDFNHDMMAAGRKKISESDCPGALTYTQGDAEQIAFPDGCFDAAMVGFGIRNLTRIRTGFEEMYRVLKPGGTMMCLEFSKPTSPFFRWFYDVYSFYVMPFLGELIAGSRTAYTHLPESIRSFPLPDVLSEMLYRIGFSNVTCHYLTNGIAVIHLARKDEKRVNR